MSDTYVNIRIWMYHFKIYRDYPYVAIEKNDYWTHYYSFKGDKRKAKFVEVYQFFNF